jgi:glutamine amidotransferase
MSQGKVSDAVSRVKVAIIDFEMCNLFSVNQACKYVGLEAMITSDRHVIAKADAIILPGVGAFGDAMSNLKRLDLVGPIKDCLARGAPLLGICLGMQLLFSESAEFGTHRGLDIVKGSVERFPRENSIGKIIRVPHVGWNQVRKVFHAQGDSWALTPLQNTKDGEYMYFVHSFIVKPEDPAVTLAVTDYDSIQFCSSININNIFGCQFHPEKSAREGLNIYKYWLKCQFDRGLEDGKQ